MICWEKMLSHWKNEHENPKSIEKISITVWRKQKYRKVEIKNKKLEVKKKSHEKQKFTRSLLV